MTSNSNLGLESPPSAQRRSRRLYLQIQVRMDWNLEDQTLISEETETEVVNAHGALVTLDSVPPSGQEVTLQNTTTDETQTAIVVFVGEAPVKDGKYRVGVEFTEPNPSFWQISFPPADWSISHSDARA